MAKRIAVEVSRKEFTTLVVDVPDDFDENQLMRVQFRKVLADILSDKAQTSIYWEDDPLLKTLEVEEIADNIDGESLDSYGFDGDISAAITATVAEQKRLDEERKKFRL